MGVSDDRGLRILLVEDDAPTRARLASAIDELADFELVASVGSCAEARVEIARSPPDVLLTDLGLPDGRGDDLIAELTAAQPEVRCLAVTVFADERTVIRAIEAGASGYLLKDAAIEDIGRALSQLADGGAPLSPSIARFLLKRFRRLPAGIESSPGRSDGASTPSESSPARSELPPAGIESPPAGSVSPSLPSESPPAGSKAPEVDLTSREREVLTLAAKGFSAKECGELLGISANTVTTHARKVYRKLSVSSRGEAVYEAVQLGLIDLDG